MIASLPRNRFLWGQTTPQLKARDLLTSHRTLCAHLCHAIALSLPVAVLLATSAAAQSAIPAYTGSDSCTDCHTDAAAAWAGSHHALAWTPPDADHIVGDFDDATFTHKGVTTTFSREGDDFFISSDGPDGVLTRYPVAGVAGIEPLQQYLLETEQGRLQSFDVTWDVDGERWYHLYPDQDLPADDGLHWTGPYKNWNARCAECHATGFVKDYDPIERSYSSTQAEIGVGCESCHGPGEAHLNWATTREAFDPSPWSEITPLGLTIAFDQSDPEAEIQQCASCHSRREPFLDGNPLPGTPYHDAYRLSLLRPGLYHADGQIQDEVYVYGSFLQSKMAAKGVRCSDCHDPHLAAPIALDNSLCTQCHNPAGNPRFPSLPLAEYDDPAHHFHEVGSAGAECKSCHMTERTYMGVDGRRDHSFRVPRPDLSLQTGSPNTCTDCHADRDAAWAASVLETRFPDSRHRGEHFSQTFAKAWTNPASQAAGLEAIALQGDLPAIVRASALDLLSQVATAQTAERLEPLLADPDPLVRASAIAAQRGAEPMQRIQRVANLLSDPARVVRSAAARAFLDAPPMRLPDRLQTDLQAAMEEWQTSLQLKSDFPETQMAMGGLALTMRNFPAALAAFSETAALDPQRIEAWDIVIRVKIAIDDLPGARATVAEALAANPDDPLLLDYQRQLQ